MLNRITDAFEPYTWRWDGQWKGARDAVIDPSGRVGYAYEPGPFGGLGRVSSLVRQWSPSGATARFDYSYDFGGNTVGTTWPDGTEVIASYTPATRWLAGHEVRSGAGYATIEHEHDQWGLPAGWSGGELGVGNAFSMAQHRATPTRLSALSWAGQRSATYDYTDGGKLSTKTVSGEDPFSFAYDPWRRVIGLAQGASDLTSLYRAGKGDWTYEPGPFSQPAGRTQGSAESGEPDRKIKVGKGGTSPLEPAFDEYTWDDTGRLESGYSLTGFDMKTGESIERWQEYAYDGAGRLLEVTDLNSHGSLRWTTYGYDVDDQLVREVHDGHEICASRAIGTTAGRARRPRSCCRW